MFPYFFKWNLQPFSLLGFNKENYHVNMYTDHCSLQITVGYDGKLDAVWCDDAWNFRFAIITTMLCTSTLLLWSRCMMSFYDKLLQPDCHWISIDWPSTDVVSLFFFFNKWALCIELAINKNSITLAKLSLDKWFVQ